MNRKLGLTGVSFLFVVATLAACGGRGGEDGSAAAPTPANMSSSAYVANFDDNNVSAYTINATTGGTHQHRRGRGGGKPSRLHHHYRHDPVNPPAIHLLQQKEPRIRGAPFMLFYVADVISTIFFTACAINIDGTPCFIADDFSVAGSYRDHSIRKYRTYALGLAMTTPAFRTVR